MHNLNLDQFFSTAACMADSWGKGEHYLAAASGGNAGLCWFEGLVGWQHTGAVLPP